MKLLGKEGDPISSFRHNRFDEELTTHRVSGATRSDRLRRVLGVLVVAVALPAAFTASQALASFAPQSSTTAGTTITSDAEPPACETLKEAPKIGEPCESKEDLSGQTVTGEVPVSDDGLKGVTRVYWCHRVGPGLYHCHLIAVIISANNSARSEALTDSGTEEAVKSS